MMQKTLKDFSVRGPKGQKTTIQMELTVVLKIYFKAISILSRLSRYQMLRKAEQFSLLERPWIGGITV